MTKKRMLQIDAMMEGRAVGLANAGKKVQVSTIELLCLVNFAEIGLRCWLADVPKDPTEGEAYIVSHLRAMERMFAPGGGVHAMANDVVALLRSDRFMQFLPPEEEDT